MSFFRNYLIARAVQRSGNEKRVENVARLMGGFMLLVALFFLGLLGLVIYIIATAPDPATATTTPAAVLRSLASV